MNQHDAEQMYQEAAPVAQFSQETLQDPRGAESLQKMPREPSAPSESPATPDAPKPRRLRLVVLALIGVCVIATAIFFLFVRGDAGSEESVDTGTAIQAKAVTELAPPEERSAAPAIVAPSALFKPAEIIRAEPRSGLDNPAALLDAGPRNHEELLPLLGTPVTDAAEDTLVDDTPAEETPAEALITIVQAKDLKAAVELLRDNRALANALDFENRPVLTYAQSVEMAELLVEAGADYEASTASGWTPLMWIAGRNGNTGVAKYLIELGAWVSIEDVKGMRPIHQAAFTGNHDLVSAFVSSGADINAIDDADVAPLHAAAWSGDLDGVKLYLSLGADITQQNKKGETPYDVARDREHEELLPMLDPDQPAASETGQTTSTNAQAGTAGTRELKFSDDAILGTVQIRNWGSTDYKAWKSIGSAWGTITVPIGKEVMLMIDMPRLDVLKTIEPEGIQVLHIRDVKLNDDQLKNLYHLKGLQRITLSRTGVSDAAVEALREALPECTIRE